MVPSHAQRNVRRSLYIVTGALFLALLPHASYNAALELIRVEWGMSNTASSVLFSIYLVGNAAAALFLIPLTDRLSPLVLIRGGLITLVSGHLLFALTAHNQLIGSLLRFIMGVGHIAAYISAVQWIARHASTAQRGTSIGILVSLGYAGTTLSFSFMGLMLNWFSTWRWAYTATALPGVIGIGLIFLIPVDQQAIKPGISTKGGRVNLLDLSILSSRPLRLMIFAYALHTAELYLARLWFPQLLTAHFTGRGWPLLEASARAASLAGLMFVTSIASVYLGGRLSDRWGRPRTAIIIFILSGSSAFLAGWLLNLPSGWLIAAGFMLGFTTAADSAIYSTAVTELAPENKLGSAQGVQSLIGFSLGAMMPVLAGFLLDSAPEAYRWAAAFSFSGLLALLGVGVMWPLRRSKRQLVGQ